MTSARTASAFAYAMVAPAVLYLLATVGYPVVDTVLLAFTDAALRPVRHWVGLDNFRLLATLDFAGVVLRTMLWSTACVACKMGIGLGGALLLNARVPGRALFRALVMPPWIVPVAVGTFMWGWMFNGQFGMVSGLLQRFGLSDGPVAFLGFPSLAFWATVATDVWAGLPLVILYLLGALQTVPQDLIEAAWMDGAGRWQRLRYIVLPHLMPALAGMTLLTAIFTFRAFDTIWILTGGGPRDATTTMMVSAYDVAFVGFRYGEGAARTVVLCVVMLLPIVLYLRATRLARAESAA